MNLKSLNSIPLLNFIRDMNKLNSYTLKFFKLHDLIRELDPDYKVGQIYKSLKKIFGKQNHYTQMFKKIYGWEFTTESNIKYIVLASKEGMTIESFLEISEDQALEIINDLEKRLQLQ